MKGCNSVTYAIEPTVLEKGEGERGGEKGGGRGGEEGGGGGGGGGGGEGGEGGGGEGRKGRRGGRGERGRGRGGGGGGREGGGRRRGCRGGERWWRGVELAWRTRRGLIRSHLTAAPAGATNLEPRIGPQSSKQGSTPRKTRMPALISTHRSAYSSTRRCRRGTSR